jgi:hypothetical protein
MEDVVGNPGSGVSERMALRLRGDKLKLELQLMNFKGWSTSFSLSLFPLLSLN